MSSSDDEYPEGFLEACEEISEAYDKFLQTIVEEDEIGFCGFPCDGECENCKGAGTFDSADEY